MKKEAHFFSLNKSFSLLFSFFLFSLFSLFFLFSLFSFFSGTKKKMDEEEVSKKKNKELLDAVEKGDEELVKVFLLENKNKLDMEVVVLFCFCFSHFLFVVVGISHCWLFHVVDSQLSKGGMDRSSLSCFRRF